MSHMRAVQAAARTARRCGLRVREPVVLRDGSNLLLHLSPAPVVARVVTATGIARHGDAWLRREVAVAGFLARAGAPVVAPSGEVAPGPHRHDGLSLTFWEYVEEVDAPMDGAEAGRGLRLCHRLLRDFDGEPAPTDPLAEAEHLVDRLARTGALGPGDVAVLRRVGEAVGARVASYRLPAQRVHGDAHLGNVLNTAAGPLWNDWEDTFHGPLAWDRACLHASAPPFGRQDPALIDAADRGYGDEPLARGVLDAFVEARRFQVAVWTLVLSSAAHGDRRRASERLAWLRGRDPGGVAHREPHER